MSFRKYLEQAGERGVARTGDGYPLQGGKVPFLRQEEFDDLPLGLNASVRVFATDKADEMAAYTAVIDKIANGLFVRLAPDREEFVRETKSWLILVRWAEIKAEVTDELYGKTGGYRT